MADVFISYSKQSPGPTHELAAILNERGLDVWWDTSLLAGERFEDALKKQLDSAKAVIVIWTPESAASDWVKWEAAIAFQQGKLITTKIASKEFGLPDPFKRHHTIDVTAISEVIAALRIHNVETDLTIGDLVAALAKNNPTTKLKVKSFLDRCTGLGFRVEIKRTLMLKFRRANKNINFATIYPDSGTVDTSYVYYFCEKLDRAGVAKQYLQGLALLTGGEILTDGEIRTQRVFSNGAPPKFDSLMADGGEQWLSLLGAAAKGLCS